ncbi:response regulator [Sphingomonas sp. BIUV-7]|uniref:Response regulator n=1 Tax=Sphingomonas natans TaxID=3063330 RepID=A0ABT8Y995_9SPHN|nr:response regulator [Sphingomonas sp. BIUV-7]MDO6414904.1 response regulator [Sphingomonas sp. BIUV-7]
MCHVLIIEDETLIALDLEDLLQSNGATSFSFAENQEDAVAAARANRPDLILSDVMLTEGTGTLAVRAIRDAYGPIPVLFITATPEACSPYALPGEIFRKPLDRPAIGAAFCRLAFAA